MARLLGTGIGLLAVLGMIWFGWEYGVIDAKGSTVPHFHREPQETDAPTDPAEDYDPVVGAMLIAKSLLPYEGPVLWDERESLSTVAALELWNAGDRGIRYAEVVLQQGERTLTFTATYIPPGGRVIVPEKDRQVYTQEAVADIAYPVVIPMEGEMGSETVDVAESGMFALTVTNGTKDCLPCVRVFYKQYDAGQGAYVGGVTYSAVLTDLKPGESRGLMLYRYAAGYAKVVAVIIEKEQPKGCSLYYGVTQYHRLNSRVAVKPRPS